MREPKEIIKEMVETINVYFYRDIHLEDKNGDIKFKVKDKMMGLIGEIAKHSDVEINLLWNENNIDLDKSDIKIS